MVMVMVKVLKLDTIDIIEVVPGLGNTILEYIYMNNCWIIYNTLLLKKNRILKFKNIYILYIKNMYLKNTLLVKFTNEELFGLTGLDGCVAIFRIFLSLKKEFHLIL